MAVVVFKRRFVLAGRYPEKYSQPSLRFVSRSPSSSTVTPVPIHNTHATLLTSAGYFTATVMPHVFYLRNAGVTRVGCHASRLLCTIH